jgi:hypothetical protein
VDVTRDANPSVATLAAAYLDAVAHGEGFAAAERYFHPEIVYIVNGPPSPAEGIDLPALSNELHSVLPWLGRYRGLDEVRDFLTHMHSNLDVTGVTGFGPREIVGDARDRRRRAPRRSLRLVRPQVAPGWARGPHRLFRPGRSARRKDRPLPVPREHLRRVTRVPLGRIVDVPDRRQYDGRPHRKVDRFSLPAYFPAAGGSDETRPLTRGDAHPGAPARAGV